METTLGDLDIQNRIGLATYRRAQTYHRTGAIQQAIREGETLRALCVGSQPEPYRVWVTLRGGKVLIANCSCPVGAAGRCKHVGALLLAWRAQPKQFQEEHENTKEGFFQPLEVDSTLRELADAFYELSWIQGIHKISPRDDRRAVEIFQRVGRCLIGSGPVGYESVRKLTSVRAAAERALLERHLDRAAIIYEGLLRALFEWPEELRQGCWFASFSLSCVRGLGRCFQISRDPIQRKKWLSSLCFVFRVGVDAGGLPIVTTTTEILRQELSMEERELVQRWLSASVALISDGTQQLYGELWLYLEAETASDERLLNIARRSGRVVDAVARLLKLGHVSEAEVEAHKATPRDTVAVARCLASHGQRKAAIRMLEAVPAEDRPVEILDELCISLEVTGEVHPAMMWAMEALRVEPQILRYRRVKRLAQKMGQWPAFRSAMERWLVDSKEELLLANVYLEERSFSEAITLAKQSTVVDVKRIVASACEEKFPREAMELLSQIVKEMITARGADGYADARPQLRAMKRLHEQLGEGPSWSTISARIREQAAMKRTG